ncbi:Rpn family recombination-promoting nuclease/putative transposase [Janthinobacterium fluminis]|uniref:Rpn family recombination-promoting nuclease/putative transposase n=1 Tax=Janthinobacterium fluminis TaxID=2987524 RepID=A0ABT5K875_9BURK|nr:Rpn family recombination-promoting nuclease/putative transposase [Janthinobacterium fluminis]MDC8760271.1 Rpn family recombination-promoting nuclease/putative transposase [Janthinobacterium fluminis]
MRAYHACMAHDHDTGYRQLFAHPEMVRDLLAGFLPYPWAKDLDLRAFERVNASYASDTGRQRHDDMVWRLRLGADWIYVYLLLEFQSRNDPWMALRMQVYVGLLCQDLVKRHELSRQGKLPPILPVVLYNGAAPWRASTDLAQLMLAPPEGLAPLQPEQRYLLIDQSSYDSATLAEQRNLIAAVFRLQRSRAYKDIRNVIASLAAWLKHGECESLRTTLTHWIAAHLQRQFSGLDMPSLEQFSEVEIMLKQEFKSWEEEWEYNAIQKGLKRGLRQGRQEGRLQADRAWLESLLHKRFGNMPPSIGARIEAAPVARIEYWYDRLFDASSLEEIFADE